MPLDFSRFDSRRYPTVGVEAGYDEWAASYDDVVCDAMDVRLLNRITSVRWNEIGSAIELACGTGRIGAWLSAQGVTPIDGVDLSAGMLEHASPRGVYRSLRQGDIRSTPFDNSTCDLVLVSLADEHLPNLDPLYAEAARLLRAGGHFVLVGFHPQFLMTCGMPTHFHRPDGQAVAIQTHVHLLSEHVAGAGRAGFTLIEMHEGLVDDEYIAAKPKWNRYRDTPVSFAFVWQR